MTLREHTMDVRQIDAPQHMLVNEPTCMTIQTSRFGDVQVRENDRFLFPTGIPGFPGVRELFLFPNPGGGCFEWLHAGKDSPLGFAVLMPDEALYQIIAQNVRTSARLLGWDGEDDTEVRLIVTIPAGTPEHATINLRAPILLNRTRSVGAQPILNDETLPYRLPLFPDAPAPSDR